MVFATLQADDFQAGFGQFHAHDGAGPAKADQHRVNPRFFDIDHRTQPFLPETLTGLSG